MGKIPTKYRILDSALTLFSEKGHVGVEKCISIVKSEILKRMVFNTNITIRNWKKTDAASLASALSNKKILNNLRDGLPYPYTEKDAEEYINFMLTSNPNDTFAYAIDVDGKAVGSIGAFRQENIHYRTAELGYYLAEEYWGKGIMTSAVRQLCEKLFAETDIIRIFAEPFDYNVGSRRVLEKAGFQLEGILKNNAFKNGQVLDMALYSYTRNML